MTRRKVEDYEIIDHGVDHSQYFCGGGTSFTEYEDCATGVGHSEREALDDALECLAMADWDVSSIEHEVEQASDEETVCTDCEHTDDEDACAECELHHFVSVRVR